VEVQQVLAAGLVSDLFFQLELDAGWRASRRHRDPLKMTAVYMPSATACDDSL
jgi:hypothetical protein